MDLYDVELHPVYGAIPRDGEIVQTGDVLGLSTDSRQVITAPFPGRVTLISTPGKPTRTLHLRICQTAQICDETGHLTY
jgi:hypothetical protein